MNSATISVYNKKAMMEKSSRESNHREPLAVGKRYVRAVKEHSGALNRTRKAVGLSVAARYSRGVFAKGSTYEE